MQTAPAARGCMAVLAQSGKKTQKMAVGDTAGIVQCFRFAKGEQEVTFKTLPEEPVSALQPGEGPGQEDKLFVVRGSTLNGINKKGKSFYRFNSNIADPLHKVSVAGVNVSLMGDYLYTSFKDNKEVAFYQSADKINDMAMLSGVTAVAETNPLLGCQDRHVRMLQGSELFYEAPCDGPVTTLQYVDPKDLRKASQDVQAGRREVLYGTLDGTMGQLFLDTDTVRRGWLLQKPGGRGAGGITAISTRFDFTQDGTNDIVVGRDDGQVQVYCFDVSAEPQSVYEKSFNESISTLDGGFITSTAGEDVVLQTFSGKVIALCGGADSEEAATSPGGRPLGVGQREKEAQAENDRKIRALHKDIELLYDKVDQQRARYATISEDLIAVNQNFHVNDRFTLNPDTATYTLTLETPVPIFTVAVQSDVPVDLQDVPNNSAILSRSPPDLDNNTMCAATYRCQDSVNRLEIKMRTIEGQFGTFRAYIIPRLSPKTCQECVYRIKPLCLHQRLQSVDDQRPMNDVRFDGDFSMSDIHTWLGFCIPEIPPKPPPGEASYAFRNVMLDTVLFARYSDGTASFFSDSITTLAVLRETITREATQNKSRINMTYNLRDESIPHFLRLIQPKLDYQLSLAKQVKLIEALREIKMQEDDVSFLAPEFAAVLENQEKIQEEFKVQPRQLEYLHGIVKDLFIDWHKFKGANVKQKIGILEQLLHQNNADELAQFIARGY